MPHDSREPPPLAACLPWSDGSGRPWPGWAHVARSAPFVPLYLLVSWALFLPAAQPVPGNDSIDQRRVWHLLYKIPDLGRDLPAVLVATVTGPWLNHNAVQLVYVTALLLLFGIVFEIKEGTPRTMAIFFGTTIAGVIGAGLLLHALYPAVLDTPFLARAWRRSWGGGSAGAFGLMGAIAARARVPWPLLGLFVLWEINVVLWYLHEYTPAFHLTALLAGFLATRHLLALARSP